MESWKEKRKKLLHYVLPSILAQVSLYTFSIFDGIFIGQGMGPDGVGAVNIAYPFICIFNALVMLVNVGGLTVMAIRKGSGDTEGMNRAFLHSLTGAFVLGLVFTVLSTVFAVPVVRLMGANDTFLKDARDYLFWYGVFMLPCALNMNLAGAVRNDGDPVLSSVGMVTATVLNLAGDWLLIFPLHLGMAGAAAASGLSQTVALFVDLSHFARKKGVLRFHRCAPDPELFRRILRRGLPECVAGFNGPLVSILYNYELLRRLGDTAENAFAVMAFLASFSIAASTGTAEGLQPLFGNSCGAKNLGDLHWYRKSGMLISVLGSAVISVLVLLFAEPVSLLFGVTGEIMGLIRAYLPVYSAGFVVLAGFAVISSYLYSTTRTKEALFINFLRSFVLDTAVILLLPMLLGSDSIWYAFAVYEIIALLIAVFVMQAADAKGIRWEPGG